jgi:hypothetical protein
MKTQLLALVAALASSPALATLGTSEDMDRGIAIQPAAYNERAAKPPPMKCGAPQNVLFLLRDESGAIVATAVVQVTPEC